MSILTANFDYVLIGLFRFKVSYLTKNKVIFRKILLFEFCQEGLVQKSLKLKISKNKSIKPRKNFTNSYKKV